MYDKKIKAFIAHIETAYYHGHATGNLYEWVQNKLVDHRLNDNYAVLSVHEDPTGGVKTLNVKLVPVICIDAVCYSDGD